MTSVDSETKINVNSTKEVDNDQEDTWIVWATSTKQRMLLKKHDPSKSLYVEGPFRMWLQENMIQYFVLKSEEFNDYDDFERDDNNCSFFFYFEFIHIWVLVETIALVSRKCTLYPYIWVLTHYPMRKPGVNHFKLMAKMVKFFLQNYVHFQTF